MEQKSPSRAEEKRSREDGEMNVGGVGKPRPVIWGDWEVRVL